ARCGIQGNRDRRIRSHAGGNARGVGGVSGMMRLDVVNAPLDGINLIEANAGTGKTWTITALYLRLLLEAQRSVESILVVTFTDAATAELRDRIRRRLADARIAFERGQVDEDDPFLAGLLGR